jgi:Mce-associated membrane protein
VRWLVTGLAGLLAAAFVWLAGAGGWLYWDRVMNHAEQTTRAELAPLAKDDIPKVFGYDYQTVERSLTDAYPLFTPAFRHEFEDRATNAVIPQARDRQVVSQVSVVGVGVIDAQRISGSVLVYMNRTVTDKSKQPTYEGNRVRVDYQKIRGKWLINDIKPI